VTDNYNIQVMCVRQLSELKPRSAGIQWSYSEIWLFVCVRLPIFSAAHS